MKNIIAAAVLSIMSTGALAAGVCHIPKDCEFISSEFSTGGGDRAMYIMEVDCKIDGEVTKYIDTEVSIGGFFGVGRITAPKKVIFKRTTNDSMSCDY